MDSCYSVVQVCDCLTSGGALALEQSAVCAREIWRDHRPCSGLAGQHRGAQCLASSVSRRAPSQLSARTGKAHINALRNLAFQMTAICSLNFRSPKTKKTKNKKARQYWSLSQLFCKRLEQPGNRQTDARVEGRKGGQGVGCPAWLLGWALTSRLSAGCCVISTPTLFFPSRYSSVHPVTISA